MLRNRVLYIYKGYPFSSTSVRIQRVDATKHPNTDLDYPKTWVQFLDMFATDESCQAYLEKLRWPDVFTCQNCGMESKPFRGSRSRLICRNCRHQITVTSGTIFDKTRTSLREWFAAAWYVTNQKHGVSALGLQRALGFKSYQTAWVMLHRFRQAMIRQNRDRLNGFVEVDETYLSITDRSITTDRKRKSNTNKLLVVIAIEIHQPKGFGRVRLKYITDGNEECLLPFVKEVIEKGSHVRTDGSAAYRNLKTNGYDHEGIVVFNSAIPAHTSLPGVHRVASLLQRWILGIHQGAIRQEHLDQYLNEFSFRFNRRSSRYRGLLFYRLMQQAVITDPITYRDVTSQNHKI